ncbi:MAG: energy transducer TonB [Pseudomonadota bacterium]
MDDVLTDTDDAPRRRSLDTYLLVGALVVVAGMLAWFFFGSDQKIVEDDSMVVAEPTVEEQQIQAVVAAETPNAELLSRARLAADAGLLVEPASSNALYYYSLYLEQEPESEDVGAELGDLLDRIGVLITDATEAEDWSRGSFIVNQVSNAGLSHASLEQFDTDLDVYRASQRSTALAAAGNGDERAANAALDRLAALPRSSTAELLELRSEVRDALVAERVAREAAAERAAQQAAARAAAQRQAAASSAASSPASASTPPRSAEVSAPNAASSQLDIVRNAIQANNLIGQDGAVALMQLVPTSAGGVDELRAELLVALAEAVQDNAAGGEPEQAEAYFTSWQSMGGDAADEGLLRARVDEAFIAEAVAEVVSAATLRRIRAVAPIYPRAAIRRELTGRLKIEFTVDTNGTPQDIAVVESVYGGVFDRSAMRAISEWRYEPRQVRGQAVSQRVYAFLEYNLE